MKYFGTDGIRGRANRWPITPEVMMRLGTAAGHRIAQAGHRDMVLIGKDTRRSGYMVQFALSAGFVSAGVDVLSVGPLPTPAVAMLTRSMRASLGVMITASHNPSCDNGVKVFDANGCKLGDELVADIEDLMDSDTAGCGVSPDQLGQVTVHEGAVGRYMEAVKRTIPPALSLDGLTVVIDCANGACYRAGPEMLRELGAEVIAIGVEPDGKNINHECGSLLPERLARMVAGSRADLGCALDGDGDRVILVDEKGAIIDGDQMLGRIAMELQDREALRGGYVVSTVMANSGLEAHLAGRGIGLMRTPVGDRHVALAMRERGYSLGGEQSGHIILGDHATTGDGMVAALQIMAAMTGHQRPASEVCSVFTPRPQFLENVPVGRGDPLADATVRDVIDEQKKHLGDAGRVVVRASGTEAVVRIMVEAQSSDLAQATIARIRDAMADHAAVERLAG